MVAHIDQLAGDIHQPIENFSSDPYAAQRVGLPEQVRCRGDWGGGLGCRKGRLCGRLPVFGGVGVQSVEQALMLCRWIGTGLDS